MVSRREVCFTECSNVCVCKQPLRQENLLMLLWPPWDFNQDKSSHILAHLWGRGRDMLPTLTWTWICQEITMVHLNVYKGMRTLRRMLGGVWSCFVDSSWIYLDWPGYALLCVAPNWPVGRNGNHQSRKQTLLFFSLTDYCGSPDGDQDGVCAIGKGRCPGYLRPGDNQYRWWGQEHHLSLFRQDCHLLWMPF